MNKLKTFTYVLTVMTAISINSVFAEEYCETLNYITKENKVIITGYEGNPEKIVIPSLIDSKEVVGIRENTFYKCNTLKEVTIPQTVNFIGRHAFFECTALENVELSDNILSMGEGCFSGCISLTEINLPDSLSIVEESCFYNCIKLADINLSEVNDIGNYAFANCLMLDDVVFSEKLINIGDYAFWNCENIAGVYIPESVMNIGSGSFGFSKNSITANKKFSLSGNENSLGKVYAQSNNIKYESTETSIPESKISIIPKIIVILSGLGLILFKTIPKIKKCVKKHRCRC